MAKEFTGVFKRVEKKYLLDEEQYRALRQILEPYMVPDEYGRSTICNIYFDTPDRYLIRTSLEKPIYKEKLRLRTYGIPRDDSIAFVELKKKYKGVVYKRRVTMAYRDAYDWLCRGKPPKKDGQIIREIAWFLHFYENLQPAAALCYDRLALYGREDHALRITFDAGIRWRSAPYDLREGDSGAPLLGGNQHLMEIKTGGGMPIWLSDALCDLKIYPTSYSKYGTAYLSTLSHQV